MENRNELVCNNQAQAFNKRWSKPDVHHIAQQLCPIFCRRQTDTVYSKQRVYFVLLVFGSISTYCVFLILKKETLVIASLLSLHVHKATKIKKLYLNRWLVQGYWFVLSTYTTFPLHMSRQMTSWCFSYYSNNDICYLYKYRTTFISSNPRWNQSWSQPIMTSLHYVFASELGQNPIELWWGPLQSFSAYALCD